MTLDLTGGRYGRLVAIRPTMKVKGGWNWLFFCDCGNQYVGLAAHVNRGRAKSCGCVRKELAAAKGKKMLKHGLIGSAEYKCFYAMHSRCSNPKNTSFMRYGGRGISVCERWSSFENFLADMGFKPEPHYSIDRIDVNGNYTPDNCKWSTPKEQANNRTNNKQRKFHV